MKNTKKILLLLIPLISFFGCELFEEEEATICLIEGTWSAVYVSSPDYGCSIYCDTSPSNVPCSPTNIYNGYSGTCLTVVFNNNNTYSATWTGDGYDAPEINTGIWESSGCNAGDMLYLDGDTAQIVELNNNILSFIDQEDDYDGWTWVFERE